MRTQRILPDVLVVGLCSHGLAVSRALKQSGAQVMAIESNNELAGSKTRSATVYSVDSIAGKGLCESLVSLARELGFESSRPWLFLTNDSMVRTIGENWGELATFYRMSWSDDRVNVLELLSKANIPSYCEKAHVDYPMSVVVNEISDCASLPEFFPAAVKPIEPMGEFKVVLANSRKEVADAVSSFSGSLPFVIQEWIPGDTESLFFVAGFAVDGILMHAFSGHKVRSWPLDSGQGSVMSPVFDQELIEEAKRFVAATGMTGPIAVEFKKRPDGRFALIEPNVGRTEYCTEAARANCVDLVRIEYDYCMGLESEYKQQTDRVVWCDVERDPISWFAGLCYAARRKRIMWLRTPFFSPSDPMPYFAALKQKFTSLLRKIRSKALS